MRKNVLIGLILMACLPFFGNAQVTKTKEKNGTVKTKTKPKPSWWTSHSLTTDRYVYFPDYYVFYEPDKGYVYWNNGKWTTTSSVPSYMSSVDLNNARIEVIDNMSVRPETEFRTYIKTYPAQKVEVTVPVPDIR